MKVRITNIKWDTFDATEFDAVDIARLPLEIEQEFDFNEVEGLEDFLSDWLSDTYGFCHFGFAFEII